MSRDPRKLRVFVCPDELIVPVYQVTSTFPIEERYGLQSQIRRSAVSAASNIVEGCARRKTKEYVNFLSIALGSAAETEYLIEVAHRLEMISETAFDMLTKGYREALKGLQKLVASYDGVE